MCHRYNLSFHFFPVKFTYSRKIQKQRVVEKGDGASYPVVKQRRSNITEKDDHHIVNISQYIASEYLTLSAFTITTVSPMSLLSLKVGLCFPRRIAATWDARRPTI